MIEITPSLYIDEQELEFIFTRSAGPGGQNVNKVSTAVQLRFNVQDNSSLPAEVKQRLGKLAGKRITLDGRILIEARQYRSQEQNRKAALERLVRLIQKALEPPKPRRKTRPTLESKLKRLETKRRRSETKRLRRDTTIEG